MMKMMKKVAIAMMAVVVALTLVAPATAQAGEKTAKKSNVIKKFDDAATIKDLGEPFTDDIALINKCGGWKGMTEKKTWYWDKYDGVFKLSDKTGTYLDPYSMSGKRAGKADPAGVMTKAQVAKSLKAMYGSTSCVTKLELKSKQTATKYWIYAKLIQIGQKRDADDFLDQYQDFAAKQSNKKGVMKAEYANIVAGVIRGGKGMDPRDAY